MPRAKLSIAVPEDVWVHDLSTRYPDVPFRIVTALASDERGIGLLELRTADPLPILADASERADVLELDLLWKREAETLVQVTTSGPSLLFPVWEAGVPIEMPFEIRDGRATWTLRTSPERFSELGTLLDETGIRYDVDFVHDFGTDAADRVLTDRQQEVLLTALDAGYYATPRQATLTDVADRLGVAKATCSDTLHRAEGNLVSWFADDHLTRPRSAPLDTTGR